jgi:hypothetical protein
LDIHGNFYIYASSSTGHAIGVFLGNTEAGQLYDIEGSFSIRSEYIGIGVAIAQDAGHMSIDGIFAIEAVQPIGVQVENISGDYALLVDAHFALYNTNPDTSTRYTKGISSSLAFNKLTTNSDTKFYSNDVNSGYIPSDNADTNSYY